MKFILFYALKDGEPWARIFHFKNYKIALTLPQNDIKFFMKTVKFCPVFEKCVYSNMI